MLDCTDCGFENSDASSFCGGCGASLAKTLTCPACSAASPPDHRFCGACGVALGSAEPLRDPRDYTPRHLAERILNSRSALEGERKHVSVLFVDVRDSTALSSEMDPEAWHCILDRFFEILTAGIHRFEGTVNQYTGDGIMALFGAPLAHEDHAQRACWAALELQKSLRDYGDELRREGTNLSVRLGLNSGEVVVGKIGDDLRMDYTAQGATVALAQRAESLAEAGRILVTANTHDLVSGYFSLRSLGPTQLRGLSEPIELFELESTGPLRTRLDASRAAGFTRFVGRAAELAQLDAALDHTFDGAGSVLGVVGEAGVGKSRLCETFAERARTRGVRVYETHSPSHAQLLSGVAARELVHSFFAVEERDTPEEARRKIAGTLVLLDPSFREALPLIFEVAGISDAEHPPPQMSPASRRQAVIAFLRELTRARSEREVAIFLFDDLHWIDPDSGEFLADLIAATQGTRTLVLTNFRAEYQADWMSGSRYQQISLRPFGRAESEALLDALIGRDPSLEPVRSLILNQAGGSPFFTEELTTSLIESGAIEGSVGDRRLVAEPETLVIPETVHGVLAGRIDRLPAREKHLLQTASVIGRDFSGPVLEAVAEVPAGEIAEAIAHLISAEFIYETQLFPQAEYRFKHALTQDVAYDGLLRERRRSVHGSTAHAFEALNREPTPARSGEIAQHFELAGDSASAARWYASAAEGTGSLISSAGSRYSLKVLDVTRDADAPELLELRLKAFVQALVGVWGDWEVDLEPRALYEEGRSLAQRLGDSNSEILLESAIALLEMNRHPTAQLDHLERALSLVGASTPMALRISLHQRISWTHAAWGNAVAAGMHAERGLALGEFDEQNDARLLGYNSMVTMLATRAQALAWAGRLDEARAALARAAVSAAAHGDPLSRNLYHTSASVLHQIEDAREEALAQAEAAVHATNALDATGWRAPGIMRMIDIHADRGEPEIVLGLYERIIGEVIGDITAVFDPVIQPQRAIARMQIQPDADARELAEETLHGLFANEQTLTGQLAEGRVCRAQLSRLLNGAAAADLANADLDFALRNAEERSFKSFTPRIHAERAALAKVCGDEAGRRRALAQAIFISREIGAPRRAERYQRELDGKEKP